MAQSCIVGRQRFLEASLAISAIRAIVKPMNITELRNLPRDEKLRIIETLWSDLAADEESVTSPAWHEEALQKIDTEFAAGRLEVIDWEVAKKELRARFE